MPCDRLDYVVRFARFEPPGDDGMRKVMEVEAWKAGSVEQRAPGGVPLARRLRWVKFVMLAGAP